MDKTLNIFKISYIWCDGDCDKILIGKDATKEVFEQNLKEARDFAISLIGKKKEGDYLGKGYSVECLPEFYHQIVWFLITKKGYIKCNFDETIEYDIDDFDPKNKIVVTKIETRNLRKIME